MIELATISKLRDLARERKMSAPESFWAADLKTLSRCYNGIGPASWPPWLRQLVTMLLQFFAVDALIHDYEWSQPNKSYLAFSLSNCRFVYNCIVNVMASGWNKSRSLKTAACGVLMGILCQVFGHKIYLAGSIDRGDNHA